MPIATRSLGLWHNFQLFASQSNQGLQFNYSPPLFLIFHPSLIVVYERLLSLLNVLMFNQNSCAYRYPDSCLGWVRMLDLIGRVEVMDPPVITQESWDHVWGLDFLGATKDTPETCLRRARQSSNARNKGKGVRQGRKNAFIPWNILLVLSCFSSYVLMPLALC